MDGRSAGVLCSLDFYRVWSLAGVVTADASCKTPTLPARVLPVGYADVPASAMAHGMHHASNLAND